jgi:hypothetical protein
VRRRRFGRWVAVLSTRRTAAGCCLAAASLRLRAACAPRARRWWLRQRDVDGAVSSDGAAQRASCLNTLGTQMLSEKGVVRAVLMEMVRSQDHRQHRNARVQLDAHQTINHRRRNELMAVHATIHHKPERHHRIKAPGLRQLCGDQRDLKRTRHIDPMQHRLYIARLQIRRKRVNRLIDEVAVPRSRKHCDA